MKEIELKQADWPYRLVVSHSGLSLRFVTLGDSDQLVTVWQFDLDPTGGPLQHHFFTSPAQCTLVQRLGRVQGLDIEQQTRLYDLQFDTESAVKAVQDSTLMHKIFLTFRYKGRTELRGLKADEGKIFHSFDLPGHLFSGHLQATGAGRLMLYTHGKERRHGQQTWYHGYHWIDPIGQSFTREHSPLDHPPRFQLGVTPPILRTDFSLGVLPYRPVRAGTRSESPGIRLHLFYPNEMHGEKYGGARDIRLHPEAGTSLESDCPGEALPWLLRQGMTAPVGANGATEHGLLCDTNYQYNELNHWFAWSEGYLRQVETSGEMTPWLRPVTPDGNPLSQPRIRAVHTEGLFLQSGDQGFFLSTADLDHTEPDRTLTPELIPLTPAELYFERFTAARTGGRGQLIAQ